MYSRNRMKRFLFISFIVSVFIYIGIQIHQYRINYNAIHESELRRNGIAIKKTTDKSLNHIGKTIIHKLRNLVKPPSFSFMKIIPSIVGWEASISRNTTEYIFPNTTTTLIKPDDLCEMPALLMVIVCSAPSNFEAREAIRNSWGLERNISDNAVKVYFLVGLPTDASLQVEIEKESEQYKDIIQENFIDTYNNLTLKSLMLLKLVKSECRSSVSYVMKTDDDMYVNLQILVKTLLARNSTNRVLFGSLICRARPIRDIYDKWYAPIYMFEGKMYPNYLSGTGYVMSVDVTETLFNTALHTPLLHLEDVYLTGICARSVGINPSHNKNFSFKKVRFDPCIYQTLITSHYNTPVQLRDLYFKVHHTDLKESCRIHKENQARLSTTTVKYRRKTRPTVNSCH